MPLSSLLKFCAVCCLLPAFAAPAAAEEAPPCAPPAAAKLQQLQAAQEGVFKALRVAEEPFYLGDLPFQDAEGKTVTLANFRGKMLLVNLWGVWCPPCRGEMPGLARMQQAHGGAGFAVVTIHDERSSAERVQAFLRGAGAESLPRYQDGGMSFYEALRRHGLARGLPVTLLADSKGCLVASVNGGVPWDAPEAWAFIKAAQN